MSVLEQKKASPRSPLHLSLSVRLVNTRQNLAARSRARAEQPTTEASAAHLVLETSLLQQPRVSIDRYTSSKSSLHQAASRRDRKNWFSLIEKKSWNFSSRSNVKRGGFLRILIDLDCRKWKTGETWFSLRDFETFETDFLWLRRKVEIFHLGRMWKGVDFWEFWLILIVASGKQGRPNFLWETLRDFRSW